MLLYDILTNATSYGTLEGNICLAPNTGYSIQPSSTEAPILVTLTEPVPTFGGPSTTVTTEGHTITDLTMSTATRLETVTDSQLYCPPPLSAYGQACVTAGTNFNTTATSATMSFNSTATVTYTTAAPTTTSVRTASTATTTRGTTNPFGISLGGPATTITSGGSTFTRYSASGGVLNSLTSTATAAATATVAPYKGDAAGRAGGAVGGVAAVGAVALWLL